MVKLKEFVKQHGGFIKWKKTGEDKQYVYGVLNGFRVRIDKRTQSVEILGEAEEK